MEKKREAISSYPLGAFVTLLIVTVWGVWIAWLHLTRPLGLEHTEILFLSAMVPIYLILLPFYWRRVRWSYISGSVVLLGLFAGVLKSVLDPTLFFSLSAYNILTVTILLTALVCIYFSWRSYLELGPVGWVKSAIGIGSLLMLSGLSVFLVSNNQLNIESYMLRRVIQGVQARTGGIEDLNDKIEALMAEGDIPSLAAAIVVKDEIVWMQGYGEQPDLDKLYDMGSITKPFVATAVLQLYERGLISLDEEVNRYLPFNVRHPDHPDVPITVRMLLTNRSCLADKNGLYTTYVMGPALRQWGVKNRDWEYRAELETLPYPEFMAGYLEPGSPYYQSNTWANCRPGTEQVYSTPGFDVLSYLVEQVSGQSCNDYLHENVFAPLRMMSTTATPLDNPGRMAIPYERWYGVLAKTNVRLPLSQRRMAGGGGLYTTVGDLSNFLLAHMNQGEFEGFQLLQPETVSLMHSRASQTSGDFMQVGYGYGWSIFQEEPRQMWDLTYQPRGYQGHGGRTWGYASAMYMVEEEQGAYGYVLLINNSMVESMDLPWYFAIQANIQDLILGEAHRTYRTSVN